MQHIRDTACRRRDSPVPPTRRAYLCVVFFFFFFFFNDPAPTEISPLSLPDALPISHATPPKPPNNSPRSKKSPTTSTSVANRSEEHTSELQSPCNLVCRLLLEK